MVFLVAQVCHLHLVDRAHQDFPFIVLVVRDALIHVHYVRQPPALTAVLHHPAQAVLKLSQPALDQVLLEGLDQVYFPPRDQVSPRPPPVPDVAPRRVPAIFLTTLESIFRNFLPHSVKAMPHSIT